jgi:hypothetical protein
MNGNFAEKSQKTETDTQGNARRSRKTVDIRALKAFVCNNYSKESAIYDVIGTNEDFLEAAEFSALVGVWLKLSRRT